MLRLESLQLALHAMVPSLQLPLPLPLSPLHLLARGYSGLLGLSPLQRVRGPLALHHIPSTLLRNLPHPLQLHGYSPTSPLHRPSPLPLSMPSLLLRTLPHLSPQALLLSCPVLPHLRPSQGVRGFHHHHLHFLPVILLLTLLPGTRMALLSSDMEEWLRSLISSKMSMKRSWILQVPQS